jgi:hypothetical protein
LPIAPIRDLGSTGVITDVEAFDLKPNMFTMAINARFAENRVQRGPVFRTVAALSTTTPRHLLSFPDTTGTQVTIVANLDGTVQQIIPASNYGTPTTTALTASGWTPSNAEVQYTSTILNDVIYLNRSDRVPWYRLRSGTTFATLPGWDSTWRCVALRNFGGVVMALGITKAGVYYPTTVKWSDLTTFQAYPGTWTPAVGNSAGENPLSDMADTIIDGFPLRDRFVIYGSNEVWVCTQTLDNNVFAFKRAFRNGGVINQNCIVEVDGTHYVFGSYDIYKTDGFSKVSLCDNRVRKFIFNGLQRTETSRFFAVHNPRLSEIEFYYVSNDAYTPTAFPYSAGNTFGCNRSATYNLLTDTWVFRDQPYVVYAGTGTISAGQTFDATTSTYDVTGGAYTSFSDSSQKTFLVVAPSNASPSTTASLYSYDQPDSTATNAPLATSVSLPMYLEKTWIDMDEVGAELRGYKVITSIYPQARFGSLNDSAVFRCGGTNFTGDTVYYDTPMTYDGQSNYKLDYLSGGRYLHWNMTYSGYNAFSLTGFDPNIEITGSR